MGASLTVTLATLWLKGYEPALKNEVPKMTVLNEDNKEVCPGCQKKKTYRTKGVECEACLKWYQLGCGNISESEYADMCGIALLAKNNRKQIGLRRVLKFFKDLWTT